MQDDNLSTALSGLKIVQSSVDALELKDEKPEECVWVEEFSEETTEHGKIINEPVEAVVVNGVLIGSTAINEVIEILSDSDDEKTDSDDEKNDSDVAILVKDCDIPEMTVLKGMCIKITEN